MAPKPVILTSRSWAFAGPGRASQAKPSAAAATANLVEDMVLILLPFAFLSAGVMIDLPAYRFGLYARSAVPKKQGE
jgi:hypothetical protein